MPKQMIVIALITGTLFTLPTGIAEARHAGYPITATTRSTPGMTMRFTPRARAAPNAFRALARGFARSERTALWELALPRAAVRAGTARASRSGRVSIVRRVRSADPLGKRKVCLVGARSHRVACASYRVTASAVIDRRKTTPAASPTPTPTPDPSPTPAPSPSPTPPPLYLGFNDNAIAWGQIPGDTDAALTQQIGANVHRVSVDWRAVEPRKDEYHLGTYDYIYKTMLARGIRPLFILLFSPPWTWDPSVSCDPSKQDCRYPPGPASDGEWQQMAAILAGRYPQAAGIEIWNEPNLHWFWQPQADPPRYTQLLKEAYSAIKAVNPDMPVISGGFSNTQQTGGGDVSLYDFTRAVYANGGKDYMDGIGFHPYPSTWSDGYGVMKAFQDVRSVRDAYGDQQKPLWVTELGVTTTGSAPATEQQQADGLVGWYRWIRGQSDVRAIILHTLFEPGDPANTSNPEVGFGIVHQDLTKKLAFCALQLEWRPGSTCLP